MAIDFARAGPDDYASRSASGFDHNDVYTALAWGKIEVDPNGFQHFIHVGGTYSYDGNTDFTGTDENGTTFRYGCAGGASSSFLTGGELTVGQQYWFGQVRESATSLKIFRGTNSSDGALIATLTNDVSGRAAASLMSLGGYNSANLNGVIALPRFWAGTALTLAQLHAEVASYSPVITANLWTAPAFSGGDFTEAMADLSGNARDWTRSGTDSSIVADPIVSPNPVATGPLTKINDTFDGYRIGGFSAVPGSGSFAIDKWRHRIEGGSWVEHGVVTFIEITGRTHGATETVDVQAGDADGNWSNTLTIEAHVGFQTVTAHALSFSGNALGNSNSRLDLAGDYRTAFTAIWKSKRGNQTDYYAECWLVQNTGEFDGGKYTVGFHPYPSDGTFDADGQRLAYDSNNHHFEMAGLWQGEGVSQDRIASQESIVGVGNQEAFPTDKAGTTWYTNVVTIELISGGTIARHRYYVDFENDPTKVFTQDLAVANIESPTSPGWQFGSPHWMGAGNTSNETPFGKHRYFKLFTAALSEADALEECQSESDAPVSTGGIASVLFSNINPTITDVTDKSGEGNDLSWGTTARPANYSESIEIEEPDAKTQTTSLSAAVQLARSASASVAGAIQAPLLATTSVALAVSAARTASASLAAAVQQARAASALVEVAVQAPQIAAVSMATAIQAARSASVDLAMAVQQAQALGVEVDLQVQASFEVGTAVSVQIQAGSTVSAAVQMAVQALREASASVAMAVSQDQSSGASLSAGVQVDRTESTSAGLAIQVGQTAGASVDLQIQEGSTRVLALQAAVQFAADASTAITVAVSQLASASLGLAAAISLRGVLGAAVDAYVREASNAGIGVSFFVLDEGGSDVESETARYRRIARAVERGVADGSAGNTFLKIGKRNKYRSM